MSKSVYELIKGRAYSLAALCAGGGVVCDPFERIMSDSDHRRQFEFLTLLPQENLSVRQRQTLLDGMAREYAGVDGWLAYVARECERECA